MQHSTHPNCELRSQKANEARLSIFGPRTTSHQAPIFAFQYRPRHSGFNGSVKNGTIQNFSIHPSSSLVRLSHRQCVGRSGFVSVPLRRVPPHAASHLWPRPERPAHYDRSRP
ncbi:unnamed protein product [Mycena citricolor]|uniref:Uncharacterized protein n=1 Tax=Mycena citricolor TaxID=2018698 RepID=A0AAD2GW23_9AGAR|nr:unnamed protein product [Mycena citricolor]